MFHCHLDTHSDTGMMLMIRVGTEKDLPEQPNHWPVCGLFYDEIKRPNNLANDEIKKSNNLANFLYFNFSLNLVILISFFMFKCI